MKNPLLIVNSNQKNIDFSRPVLGILSLSLVLLCFAVTQKSVHAQGVVRNNRLAIEMVNIRAGSFVMGACRNPTIKDDIFGGDMCKNNDGQNETKEFPSRLVTIKSFQIGKTEVTLAQYMAYLKASGRTQLATEEFMKHNANGDNHPVTAVSWADAQEMVNWLNQNDGGGWRLPSEAEWEYACRAGESLRYCGSQSAMEVAWYWANSERKVQRVGTKSGNVWGLHDMSGNVSEWVQDCFHTSYRGAPVDGKAWEDECVGDYKMTRGGAWNSQSNYIRASDRYESLADLRQTFIGFRLARTK
jgi:formylglycine-generating enzyme required for sulfatase activity